MKLIKSFSLAVSFLFFAGNLLHAEVPSRLVDDFSQIDGAVLMARDGEVLIDAAAQGVRVGDLFAVAGKTEKIIHPKSGELLGERETVAGVLQVVQVRPGFSITRQLSGEAPAAGAVVQRNRQIEARLVDLGTDGELFAAGLRQALPELNWQAYQRVDQNGLAAMRVHGSDQNGLLFLLDGDRLEVRGPGFELLRHYEPVNLQIADDANAVALPVLPSAAAAATPAPMATGGGEIAADVAAGSLSPLWSGLGAKKLPIDLQVADLDGDGRQEIVRAFIDRIEIGRLIGEAYEPLQEIELSGSQKALSLSAIDLNTNGRPELYVTVAAGSRLDSRVYEFSGGEYRVVDKNIRWFLNVVDLPGEGEVLLGQERDRSLRGISRSIYRLSLQGGELIQERPLTLPKYATIYSLSALPGASGSQMLRINDDGRLEVFDSQGEPLWVSSDSGTSETGFTQPDPGSPSGVDAMENETFLPTPMTTAGPGTVVTVMNQGITASALLRQMSSARIAVWNWNGIEMKQAWGQEIDGYVPALQFADANNDGRQELVVMLAFPNSNPFSSRKSVIRLYEFK